MLALTEHVEIAIPPLPKGKSLLRAKQGHLVGRSTPPKIVIWTDAEESRNAGA